METTGVYEVVMVEGRWAVRVREGRKTVLQERFSSWGEAENLRSVMESEAESGWRDLLG